MKLFAVWSCVLALSCLHAMAGFATLPERLAAAVSNPKLSHAQLGIKVVSLETGKTIYEHNAGQLLVPASNTKLFTCALALDRLGADGRIQTTFLAQSKPDTNGVLNGDLIVFGRGDPSFSARFAGGHADAALALVDALAVAGVTQINGDLVGDESYFRGSAWGEGWAWDDLQRAYGASCSALTFDDNTVSVTIRPGKAEGNPCLIQGRTNVFAFANGSRTLAAGAASTLEVFRAPGESTLNISGGLPLDSGGYPDIYSVPNPAQWFLQSLKEALTRKGITVSGKLRVLDRLAEPSDKNTNLVALATVKSRPVSELVRETLKTSQNLYAQLLFLQTGARARRSGPADVRARVELEEFLRDAQIPAGEVVMKEGAGMSSSTLVTPNAVVGLLMHMRNHRAAAAFTNALPVAGVDGTLQNRFKGTAAEKRLRAKTGSKEMNISLSGYGVNMANERFAFSIILNHCPNSRAEMDAIAVMLAE